MMNVAHTLVLSVNEADAELHSHVHDIEAVADDGIIIIMMLLIMTIMVIIE